MANFSMKLASTVSAASIVASAMSASLVSAASEFLPYAEALANNKVINSTTEAGYRLNDYITRAELAKVAANLGQYTKVSCTGTVYTDVNKSLGDLCDAIETLANAKVVTTATTTFRPNANVTRAEMTKMLLGALGETQSMNSAGYADVNATLGDLQGFINRAAEKGCVQKATYFRPNANGSRGEVFKIAACSAGLNVDTTTPTTTTTTTPTTPTTSATWITVTQVGTATAQYVPMNASSVKVGTIKITANAETVVKTVTISRSGLGDITGLSASLAQNGVIVGNARTFNTTSQDVILRLNTPVTLKAGASMDLDVLASLPSNGTQNSQHQFAVTAVNGTAISPITLGLLNTTSYAVSTVTGALSGGNSIKLDTGLTAAKIYNLSLQAQSGRNVTVHSFTLSKTNGNDLSQALANVKVFRNGVALSGATATVTSDKIIVTGLESKINGGDTAYYELRADTTYVGKADTFTLNVSNTEDISATEDITGYVTRVGLGNTTMDLITNSYIVTPRVTTTTTTVVPGSSNVTLMSGSYLSTSTFEAQTFSLKVPTGLNDKYSSLTLDVAGSSYDLLSSASYFDASTNTFKFPSNNSFTVNANEPVNVMVRGTVKSTAPTTNSDQNFVFKIETIKNVNNGVVTAANIAPITGTMFKIAGADINLKASTVAAPINRNIGSSQIDTEIGRLAIEAVSADIRVGKITVKNTATTTGAVFTDMATDAYSFKLIDIATNAEIPASKVLSTDNTTLEFTLSPAVVISKDTLKNIKLVVSTKSFTDSDIGKNFVGKFVVSDIYTDNGSSITQKEFTQSTTPYVTSYAVPTVTVQSQPLGDNNGKIATIKITNTDTQSDINVNKVILDTVIRSTANGTLTMNSGATICLRNVGTSSSTCTTPGVSITAAGITATPLSVPTDNAIATKNGGYVEYEVFIQNAPLWVAGDNALVRVTGLNYTTGTQTTEQPYSVAATSTK